MFGFTETSKDFFKNIFVTRRASIAVLSGTLAYVTYINHMRYQTIVETFNSGKIAEIAMENTYETTYFKRPRLETLIKEITGPNFSNRYYLIKGEVGTGKSRTLKETTRAAILERGSEGHGAPVYVLASQGATFADTLAEAVGFKFNEHLNIKFLIRCMLQIEQLPKSEENTKLQRTLEAIEKACIIYRDRHGRAAVLIIDAADALAEESVKKLQAKAKLWADSNVAKVIFVSCDEKTERIMQENTSYWSRAAEPIYFGDLTRTEAFDMLRTGSLLENESNDIKMDEKHAQNVYDLVGGRVMHLLTCKRDYHNGVTFKNTTAKFIAKERGKFVKVSQNPNLWKAVMTLQKSPEKTILLDDLVKETSLDSVNTLAKQDIIRFQQSRMGMLVKFQSPVTAKTIDEFCRTETEVKAFYGVRNALFSRSFFSVITLLLFGRKPTVTELEVLDILAGN